VAAGILALSSHGDATWATAAGFSTPTNVADAVTAIEAHGDGAWTTATGFSTFDSNTDLVTLIPDYDAAKTAASQTSVDDLPTNSELATALGAADDAVLAQMALVKAVTDKVDTSLVLDGAVYQFTANSLELAPGGPGGGGLDAAGVRAAVGLASANLDDQLSAIPSAGGVLDANIVQVNGRALKKR
jgi:hypothetical protein